MDACTCRYAACSALRLCALRHSKTDADVVCSQHPLEGSPDLDARRSFATISKSHTSIPDDDVTVLCTSRSAAPPSARCAHLQELPRLLAQGQTAEVHALATAFGLSKDETWHLQHHLRLWGIIRKCCGYQASKHARQLLQGRAGSYREHDPANPMCNLYNLDEVEAELLTTMLGRRFEVHVTAGGKFNPKFTAGYCKLTRDKIAGGLGFNGKPEL